MHRTTQEKMRACGIRSRTSTAKFFICICPYSSVVLSGGLATTFFAFDVFSVLSCPLLPCMEVLFFLHSSVSPWPSCYSLFPSPFLLLPLWKDLTAFFANQVSPCIYNAIYIIYVKMRKGASKNESRIELILGHGDERENKRP